MSESNPLFNGQLVVSVGGHDFTAALLPGLSWSTTNPGGFGECTFQIESSDPNGPYVRSGHTMAKGDAVTIVHGTTTLFEGTITGDVSHPVISGGAATYDVTAAGLWWKAGLRKDFCRVWTDDDPGKWFETTSGGAFQVDTDGKLDIRLEAGQSAKNGASKSLYYWLDSGMGQPNKNFEFFIGSVQGNVSNKDTAQWHADISTSDSPWGTWTVQQLWENETISSGTVLFCEWLAYDTAAVRLRLFVDNATSTGTTADRYITLTRFSLVHDDIPEVAFTIATGNPATITSADHGLQTGDRIYIESTTTSASVNGWRTVTRTGDDTFTIPVNVTSVTDGSGFFIAGPHIDDAMCDVAVTTGLASASEKDAAGIGNAHWGLSIPPHCSRAEAIETIAGMHYEPLDYGFWEDSTFHVHARTTPTSGTNYYLIDSTAPGVDYSVFCDTENTPDAVKVTYLFRDVDGGSSAYPDGTLRAVYRPLEPTWTDASVQLDVWDEWSDLTMEEGQAEAIGDQILHWLDANAYTGTIVLNVPTVTTADATQKNAAYIRAGDYIEDLSLSTGPLMVTSCTVDADEGTVTLGIGESRQDFVRRATARWQRPVIFPYKKKGRR